MTQQKEKKKRTSLERYHLKKRIEELAQKESEIGSTTLITLYIPPGTRLSDISQKLVEEQGTADQIKDKNTGKAVSEALRSILSRMQYLENGENGLAIFAGRTADEGMEYYAIEPPDPIGKKDYICDDRFHVDHLREMIGARNQLGIIVIDRGGATFATVKGNYLNIITEKSSPVPGKHSRGGQSAARIERGIEIMAKEWFGRMAKLANQLFLEEHEIEALVVGGPAMSKESFLDNPELDYRLKEKLLNVYDVGYTGEPGVRELLSRAEDDLEEYALVKEKKLIQNFLKEISEDSGKAIYGEKPVKKAFKMSAVETLLFSEGIERIHLQIQCSNCDKETLEVAGEQEIPEIETKLKNMNCPSCDSEGSLQIIDKQYLIDEFERLAEQTGAEIEIIGTGHDDGLMLMNTFTGIAAILRYPVDLSTLNAI